MELIQECKPEELDEFLKIAVDISEKLIEEIKAQRALSLAENGELILDITNFSTKELLKEVLILYQNHQVGKNKTILIEPDCTDQIINSDKTILRRVLGNLVKNALEASKENSTVWLNCKYLNSKVTFFIKNEGFIPKQIQLQIFHRSLTTKGSGRGTGTYSVKLLTEKYLKGSVAFESTESDGTVFKVSYPKNL